MGQSRLAWLIQERTGEHVTVPIHLEREVGVIFHPLEGSRMRQQ